MRSVGGLPSVSDEIGRRLAIEDVKSCSVPASPTNTRPDVESIFKSVMIALRLEPRHECTNREKIRIDARLCWQRLRRQRVGRKLQVIRDNASPLLLGNRLGEDLHVRISGRRIEQRRGSHTQSRTPSAARRRLASSPWPRAAVQERRGRRHNRVRASLSPSESWEFAAGLPAMRTQEPGGSPRDVSNSGDRCAPVLIMVTAIIARQRAPAPRVWMRDIALAALARHLAQRDERSPCAYLRDRVVESVFRGRAKAIPRSDGRPPTGPPRRRSFSPSSTRFTATRTR